MPAIVVIDTNVWVSAFINPYGPPAMIKEAFTNSRFEVVVSVPLLEEVAEVLSRPRIRDKYALCAGDIAEFLSLLSARATRVAPRGSIRVCRDPDDDLVLETALLGNARYMISRDDDIKFDRDLIAHMESRGIRVLSIRQFLEQLSAGTL